MLHVVICASVHIIPSSWLQQPVRLPDLYPHFWSVDPQAKGYGRLRVSYAQQESCVLHNSKLIQSETISWVG